MLRRAYCIVIAFLRSIRSMRLLGFCVAVVIAVSVAACGGEDAAPLPPEQRVSGEADAPGSQADPEETPVAVTGIEGVQALPDGLFSPEAEDVSAMEAAGFVSGLVDTRFFPSEPGAEHVGDEAHVATLVVQLGSEEGAADMARLLHEDGLEPCPGSCVVDISEFEVADIPNAQGVARITTAEDLEATGAGADQVPFAAYKVTFADGPFAYEVDMFGPPDKVSQEQAEEIAKNLYERVEGSPPAQQ
jgi:hypothetical protein